MYVPDLKAICDLDLDTVLFEIKNPYRHAKTLTGALHACKICAAVRIFDFIPTGMHSCLILPSVS